MIILIFWSFEFYLFIVNIDRKVFLIINYGDKILKCVEILWNLITFKYIIGNWVIKLIFNSNYGFGVSFRRYCWELKFFR